MNALTLKGLLCACLASAATTASADSAHQFENELWPAFHLADSAPPRWKLEERMAFWHVPGVSIAIIRSGKLVFARGYGVTRAGHKTPIDKDTMFSVGSLSKVGAAAITLRLKDAGKIELDRDVGTYLKTWKVPASAYALSSSPTLRGLMSHTAGFTVPGFADFLPGETLPTTIQTLNGVSPAKEDAVKLTFSPGSNSRYSGGGTTVLQLVLEDATKTGFEMLAQQHLFGPLGMKRSSYRNPLPKSWNDVAAAHDANGQPVTMPQERQAMPQIAASGLWTTPSDYAKLMIALYEAWKAKPGAFLKDVTAHEMMTEVAGSRVGLGPFLTGSGMDRRFYHSGANDSYRAWMEMNLETGNGVVIFTNGTNGNRLWPEIQRAVATVEKWHNIDAVELPHTTLSMPDLIERAGTYVVKPDNGWLSQRLQTESAVVAFDIRQVDGELEIRSGADPYPWKLGAAGKDQFVLARSADRTVQFVRDYRGRITGLIYRDREYAVEATRQP